MNRMTKGLILAGVVLATAAAGFANRYPLDGYEYTGIRRLRAYSMQLDGTMPGGLTLAAGAKIGWDDIRLNLRGVNDDFDVPRDLQKDAALQAGIERIMAQRSSSYRIAVLDITDPEAPRYASVKQDEGYIPGSVGKLLVTTALFNELRKVYPNDPEARARILRETQVVADAFSVPNSHTVPIVAEDWSSVTNRSIRIGDEFSLWEWMDHALSPSSNGAGSMVWKEALLVNQFGRRYPVSQEEADAFIRNTPRAELTAQAIAVIEEPLIEMGLDTNLLRLRTFFTRGATAIIPGQGSHATPRTLMRWLVKLEQGKVVDSWSSLEIKRLMYFTRRRYRYAASPALANAAVFFKSGSLYRCVPEEGFTCGQYMGNAENLMHSVAIIEAPAGGDSTGEHARVYMVSMMSNVLRVNSAAEHLEIATQVDRLIAGLHPN